MPIYLIKLPSKKEPSNVSTYSRVNNWTDKQSIILRYKTLASRSILATGVFAHLPICLLPLPRTCNETNFLFFLTAEQAERTLRIRNWYYLYDAGVLVSNFYVGGGVGLKFVLMNHVNSSLCHLTIGFTQHFWLQKRELSLSTENSSRITLLPQVHQGLEEKFRESQVQIL